MGLWPSAQEAAKFWPRVLTEIRNRRGKGTRIADVDAPTSFPDAVSAVCLHDPDPQSPAGGMSQPGA